MFSHASVIRAEQHNNKKLHYLHLITNWLAAYLREVHLAVHRVLKLVQITLRPKTAEAQNFCKPDMTKSLKSIQNWSLWKDPGQISLIKHTIAWEHHGARKIDPDALNWLTCDWKGGAKNKTI